jgi:hypothetical protein
VADLGKLLVKIDADTSGLAAKLQTSKQGLNDVGSTGTRVGKALNVGLMAGAASAGALALALKKVVSQQLKEIDAISKTADRLGTTTEAVVGLQHITDLTGASFGTLSRAMQKLDINLGNIENRGGPASDSLAKIGLTTQELKDMEPDQAFFAVADALGSLEDRSVAAMAATDLLGRSGVTMLGVFRENKGNFQDMSDEAKRMGLAFSRDAGRKIEQFNDSMTRLSGMAKGLARQFTVEMGPSLSNFAHALERVGMQEGILDGITKELTRSLQGYIDKITWAINLTTEEGRKANALTIVKQHLAIAQNDLTEAYKAGAAGEADLVKTKEKMLGLYLTQIKLERELGIKDSSGSKGEEEKPPPAFSGGGKVDDAAERLQAMIDQFANEEEQLKMSHERQLEEIAEFEKKKLLTAQESAVMREMTEKEMQDKLLDIQKNAAEKESEFSRMAADKKITHTVGELASLAQAFRGSGKEVFEIQKAGALAAATISTYEGVAKSLSFYPQPLASVMAAAHLAAGLSQVNEIRNTKYDSGAKPKKKGLGGGGGASAAAAGGGGGGGGGRMQDIRISLDADDSAMFSGRQVRSLMERMGNELSNGENFGSFQVVRG